MITVSLPFHPRAGFRHLRRIPVILLLVILVSSTPLTDAKCKFPAIFNFGDSNSDTGGFWAAFPAEQGPFGMTYFKKPAGRASDGRVVIDFLAQALGLPFLSPYLQSIGSDFRHGANFATAASTVLTPYTSLFVSGVSPFSLAIQLNQMKELRARVLEMSSQAQALGLPFLSPYLESTRHGANFAKLASRILLPDTSVSGIRPFSLASKLNKMKELRERVLGTSSEGYLPPPNIPPPNIFSQSLYTIDIGQNDFTEDLAIIGIEGVKQYLPQVLSQIAETIKELYEIGGRTFLVSNLAPIGCYPAFLTELPHNSSDLDNYGCMISYNNAVEDYNKLLKETLSQTRDQLRDASIIYVDTHSVKLELFRHPKDHGFLHGSKACCGYGGGDYNYDTQVYCGNSKVINGRNMTATACADPENYVSWDGIHATEAANKILTWAILSGSYFDPPFPLSELCDLNPIG